MIKIILVLLLLMIALGFSFVFLKHSNPQEIIKTAKFVMFLSVLTTTSAILLACIVYLF